MNKAVSRLSDPGVELQQALAWLHERTKEEYFSLSDIWAVLISAGIMKQVPEQHYFYINCSARHVNKLNQLKNIVSLVQLAGPAEPF